MRNKFILIIFILLFKNQLIAQEIDSLKNTTNNVKVLKDESFQEYNFSNGSSRIYKKPKWLDIVTLAPKDIWGTAKSFVQKDNAWYLVGALLSTGALIPLDQKITDNSRNYAENIGLSAANKYGKFGPLQNIPQNIGAGFYLFGNGTTVILMSAGFATYGLLKNDFRAQATASGLMESLILSGVFAQTVKRITGRESPFIAIENGNHGGDWNPFPSFAAYANNTPNYDAVPSGHLTTIMSALTVITTNYPEYKWIKPIGYTLIAGMSYQMIQSQVHWASDYPMAIFMGYFIGKTIAKGRFEQKTSYGNKFTNYKLEVIASKQYGFNSVGLMLKF